jgi:hypothetical protein
VAAEALAAVGEITAAGAGVVEASEAAVVGSAVSVEAAQVVAGPAVVGSRE